VVRVAPQAYDELGGAGEVRRSGIEDDIDILAPPGHTPSARGDAPNYNEANLGRHEAVE
jgi:hypothetical protein